MDLFRHPLYLLPAAIAAIGALLLGAWTERRRGKIAQRFASLPLLDRLRPAQALKHRRARHRLRAAALTFLFVALAAPQWGVELVTTQFAGVQAVIAVDVSLSMMTEDIRPNRMERAKNTLSFLIDGLRGQRLGLVAFAGEAQIQCPLTTDSEAVKTFLYRMNPGAISRPGTAIGKAIRLSAALMRKYPGQKAIVLLTDGEDHDSGPLEAARAAAENGARIFVVGMGTPEGGPIPVQDSSGRTIGYKKDSKDQTVVSRLAEKSLIEIAEASSGAYYRATTTDAEASEILRQVLEIQKSPTASGSVNRYRNRYRLPLMAAFLLLLIELFLGDWRPREERAAAAVRLLAAAALLPLSGCGVPTDFRLWRGNAAYRSEKYDAALERYETAGRKHPKDPRPLFNSGTALYKMDRHAEAEKAFAVSAESKSPSIAPKDSHYDMGNALYRQKKMSEAALAYRKCLKMDPSDEDCRHNLVLALKKPPEKKNQEQKDDKNDSPAKPPPSKPQSSAGGSPNNPGFSREDAERILQAIKEKEKAAMRSNPAQPEGGREKPSPTGEDW